MITLKADHNVVIFSEPGEEGFVVCHQEDFGLSRLFDPVDKTFVIRAFDSAFEPLYIKAEVMHQLNDPIHLEYVDPPFEEKVEQEKYIKMVERARTEAEQMEGKVVLSRIDQLESGKLDLRASLEALRKKFPNSFVYLLTTEVYGTWMGATPEVLVKKDEEDYETMSLAGTKAGEELFTQKEFDEQLMVTKDIVAQLYDVPTEVGDLHESSYGELRHLRNFIRWQSNQPMFEFAERLHPTPAVSGYPRENAMALIEKIEEHTRGLYSGFIGLVKPSGTSTLFVNLRCMRLFSNQLWFFVGGGINADSEAKSEWKETEQKKEAVLRALVYE